VPRFEVRAPLDVTVVRSGVPDTVPGRSLNVCERGIAAMLAGELTAGEVVGVEIRLPLVADTLQTRAMVRYQDKLRCGMEFLGLTAEQRGTIREWSKEAKAEPETTLTASSSDRARQITTEKAIAKIDILKGNILKSDIAKNDKAASGTTAGGNAFPGDGSGNRKKKRQGMGWAVFCVLLLLAASSGWWWRWNREWTELESGLKTQGAALAEKPQAQVPAEVMEKLLVHRVEPAYPAEARKEKLQGVIALDIVVGRDGSVLNMRALNGPEILARAAMDGLRWWKFSPYRVNGEPAVVETTVAVEFKR
jgi:TonB family protein